MLIDPEHHAIDKEPMSSNFGGPMIRLTGLLLAICVSGSNLLAQNWPGWRGLTRFAVNDEQRLPSEWDAANHVRWKTEVPGSGFSSPVVWENHVYLTSAQENGFRRLVHCLDRATGKLLWTQSIEHDDPEVASAMTGHAASTPATDGQHIVAVFGNAGVVCHDPTGKLLWRRDLGHFASELGLANSPWIEAGRVYLVCDHDGDRFKTFDSYLTALDLATGRVIWKTDRRGLFRSWSSPVVIEAGGRRELLVNGQDELRSYNPADGHELWRAHGMAGWVTPTPVFGHGLIFAQSGRDGPVMAIQPGGLGDVTASHIAWQKPGGPYVCSAVLYGDHLYVHNEQGVLTCFVAATGETAYRQRLEGKFWASSVAGDGKVYITNENGTTFVVRAGPKYELLATNKLDEYTLASPAISAGEIFIRTEKHLWCMGSNDGLSSSK